MQYILYAEDL